MGGLMRRTIFLFIIAVFASSFSLAQRSEKADRNSTGQEKTETVAAPKLPPAAPLLSPAICGKGTFLFTFGNQPLGRETFEINCLPDGSFAAGGHTDLRLPGATVDLNMSIELNKAAVPMKVMAKGKAGGIAIDQILILKDGTATLTSNGSAREIPCAKDAAYIPNNVFYPLQFVLARYNAAQGGEQQITAFPNVSVKIERAARDVAQATGMAVAAQPSAFDRYTLRVGAAASVLWVDMQGRVAVVMIPTQNFVAAREEYSAFTGSLRAALGAASEPDYSAPPGAPFAAEEVTVQAKSFTLAGTLLLPKTGKPPYPAVITITGSGQQTRSGPVPIPGLEKYRPFRQIAEALASRGIAVLYVDDRGVGKSTGFDTLATATTSDFADDVRAQVEYLRKRSEIDPNRIALVGHSEGGIIAPMVAATDPRIAAIVLMAGTAKRGDDVLADQMKDLVERDPTLTEEERTKKRAEHREMLRAVIEGGDTSKVPEMLRSPWFKEFLAYDPLTTIRRVRQPILILQGALDRQVTAEQATMLEQAARQAGNKDVTTHIFPNLNHLFLPARTGAFSEYSSLETSVIGDEVLKILSDWLRQKLGVSD